MVIAMFFFNPLITLIGTFIFILSYSGIYLYLKPILQDNSKQISSASAKRLKKISEGFRSIKEIIIFNNQNFFIIPFKRAGIDLANARGKNLGITITPRYFIEFIAFSSIIILILITLAFDMQSIETLLPTLSFFAFAALKLMPCLQQVYAGVSQVRGNIHAFDSIKDDLKSFSNMESLDFEKIINSNKVEFNESIELSNVSFKVKGLKNPILSKITFKINKGDIIALVGPSGSGKTTVSDLLLGLHSPTSGQ
jgi:HlyD family secretion protein